MAFTLRLKGLACRQNTLNLSGEVLETLDGNTCNDLLVTGNLCFVA